MRIRSQTACRNALPLVASAALALLSGCYENVVGAKGMGAQGVSISQPNNPDGNVTSTTKQKRSLKLDNKMTR